MSAIHTGSIAVRLRNDGLLEYTGTSEDHAVPGWDANVPEQDARVLIPAQRAGNAYEQVVLDAGADGLADLRDYVHIPTLSAFVRELLGRDSQKTADSAIAPGGVR